MRARESGQREIRPEHRLDRHRRDEVAEEQLQPRIAPKRPELAEGYSRPKQPRAATPEISSARSIAR